MRSRTENSGALWCSSGRFPRPGGDCCNGLVQDLFIVLGTDGVFDVLSNQEMTDWPCGVHGAVPWFIGMVDRDG